MRSRGRVGSAGHGRGARCSRLVHRAALLAGLVVSLGRGAGAGDCPASDGVASLYTERDVSSSTMPGSSAVEYEDTECGSHGYGPLLKITGSLG